MRPQRLTLLWQRSGRPGSFYAPTLHEPAYLLARVSRARPNQHRHRLLQATAFCILLQPPPRKRTQPVLQSPSQITVSIHAFTQAACAGRAGLSPKRRNPLTKVVICSQPHQESHRRHSLSLFIFLSPYLCLSLSRLSSFSLRGALPLALGLIYIRSPEDTIDTSTCSNGVLPLPGLPAAGFARRAPPSKVKHVSRWARSLTRRCCARTAGCAALRPHRRLCNAAQSRD